MIENNKVTIVGNRFIKICTPQTLNIELEMADVKFSPIVENEVIYIPLSSIHSITANIKDPKSNDITYVVSIEYGKDCEKISLPINFEDLQEFESKLESL